MEHNVSKQTPGVAFILKYFYICIYITKAKADTFHENRSGSKADKSDRGDAESVESHHLQAKDIIVQYNK